MLSSSLNVDNSFILGRTARRTKRCSDCHGQGKVDRVIIGQLGEIIYRQTPAGPVMATEQIKCHCTAEHTLDLGTRRSGMVGVGAGQSGGKHGTRGRFPTGTKPTKKTFRSFQPHRMSKQEIRAYYTVQAAKEKATKRQRQIDHKNAELQRSKASEGRNSK